MLHRSRWTLVSFLLLLALVVPTNLVQAQSKPQALPDKNVAPSANLAVPDEVAQVVKLRESLTADQKSKMQAILDSHKAELQQISSDLASLEGSPSAQDKKLFLPFVNANGNNANASAESLAKPADMAATPEKAAKLNQITVRLTAVQAKIDQEVGALLTASQSEVYAKQSAKLKSAGQAVATKLQALAANSKAPAGTDATSDCYYGAYYAAYASLYSYYGYYYAYYNYYYYGGNYGYYSYLYAYYGYYYYGVALPLAGGAYFDSAYGSGNYVNSLSSDAYTYLYYGYYYDYYGYVYGVYAYNNEGSHTYAYYAYYYSYYGYYYGYNYAYYYEYYC
jgi:hypothetical protein